jgi:curli biogenesis system outer membrane secretion channel CsgG
MRWFFLFSIVLALVACPSTGPAVQVEQQAFIQPLTSVKGLTPPENSSENDTLIQCINKSTADLSAALPQGLVLGVIKISSSDEAEAEFAEEQLIFCLVQTGKYRIVERKDLDIIRREQNFQLSGDVDDATAVSIGRMAGAKIVITGTILPYGAGKYLNVRALDVETAQIQAASSRFYSSLF